MKLSILLLTFLLSICASASNSVNDANPVVIGTFKIPGLIQDKDNGLFIDLYKAIAKNISTKHELIIEPIRRVQINFNKKKVDCYFPAIGDQITLEKSEILRSKSIWLKSVIAFTRVNTPLPKNIKELEGKRVGISRGYSYGPEIKKNSKIILDQTNNDTQSLQKLDRGWVDIILGDSESTVNELKRLGLEKKLKYNINSPINILDVFFVCHNNEIGSKIIEKINKSIEQLYKRKVIILDRKRGHNKLIIK